MKALIVILAIVFVTFFGLLVYGTHQDEQPKSGCDQPKGFGSNSDPTAEQLKDWCPPKLANATSGLQARFAPGLGFTTTAEVPALGISITIPEAKKDRPRMARLTLQDGSWVVANGPNDAKQCLCRTGTLVPNELRGDTCDENWRQKQESSGWVCTESGSKGVIPFGKSADVLKFRSGGQAIVLVE